MKAPAKVLLFSVIAALVMVFIVFYRFGLIFPTHSSPAQTTSVKQETPMPMAQNDEKTPDALTASLENGKKLYESQTCVLCHGANGKADNAMGVSVKATDFTKGVFQNNKENLPPIAYIIKVIEEGVPGTAMVSFKDRITSEKEKKDLAEYVHSFSQKK